MRVLMRSDRGQGLCETLPDCSDSQPLAPPTPAHACQTLSGTVDPSSPCHACEAGKVAPRWSQSACEPCGLGQFQPLEGQTSCNPAPRGSFVPLQGQESALQCAEGTFAGEEGSDACATCPPGKFQDSVGALDCVDVPPRPLDPDVYLLAMGTNGVLLVALVVTAALVVKWWSHPVIRATSPLLSLALLFGLLLVCLGTMLDGTSRTDVSPQSTVRLCEAARGLQLPGLYTVVGVLITRMSTSSSSLLFRTPF